MYIFMPPEAIKSLLMSRCLVPMSAFLSLYMNTERISMKFVGAYHFRKQTNWLHFGWSCTSPREQDTTEIWNWRQAVASV